MQCKRRNRRSNRPFLICLVLVIPLWQHHAFSERGPDSPIPGGAAGSFARHVKFHENVATNQSVTATVTGLNPRGLRREGKPGRRRGQSRANWRYAKQPNDLNFAAVYLLQYQLQLLMLLKTQGSGLAKVGPSDRQPVRYIEGQTTDIQEGLTTRMFTELFTLHSYLSFSDPPPVDRECRLGSPLACSSYSALRFPISYGGISSDVQACHRARRTSTKSSSYDRISDKHFRLPDRRMATRGTSTFKT